MEKKRKLFEREEEYAQGDMCPDRTMSDFYCKICDAHMNSEQMWESHISGKRHLKNVKKEPGEMPSKVKAIKVNSTAKLMDAIYHHDGPFVGLGFMTELQRADPGLNPSYTCHLCQANLTWSVVIEHILGTKHRLAYLKAVDPEQYDMIDNMELKKNSLDRLAEDRAREYERKRGCGTMEVKLEKPKVAPPPPKREKLDEEVGSVSRPSRSLSSESRIPEEYDKHSKSPPRRYASPPAYRRRRPVSPVDGKWRHDRYSPGPSPPPSSHYSRSYPRSAYRLPDPDSLSEPENLNFLRRISEKMILVSDTEVCEVKTIINALAKNVLQFLIKKLPIETQNLLAKHLVKSDIRNFERELRPTLEFVFDALSSITSSDHHHHRHHHHHRRSSSSSKYLKRHGY